MLFHQLVPFCHRRVNLRGEYQSGYSYYLRFQVTARFDDLLKQYNTHKWSPEQQSKHDLIKSLHDSGMGYRKIAKYLNEKGIKTETGKEFKNTNVFSVLKRYKERQQKEFNSMKEFEPKWSDMWLEFSEY